MKKNRSTLHILGPLRAFTIPLPGTAPNEHHCDLHSFRIIGAKQVAQQTTHRDQIPDSSTPSRIVTCHSTKQCLQYYIYDSFTEQVPHNSQSDLASTSGRNWLYRSTLIDRSMLFPLFQNQKEVTTFTWCSEHGQETRSKDELTLRPAIIWADTQTDKQMNKQIYT